MTDVQSPAVRLTCPHGDMGCPCADGLMCHYEGPDAWPEPGAFAVTVPGVAEQMCAHDIDAKICGKPIVSTQDPISPGSFLPAVHPCRLSAGHDGACNHLIVGQHPKRVDGNTAALHD